MKLQILSELDDSNIVIQHLNKIIYSWSEIEILEETPKLYCLISSYAIDNIRAGKNPSNLIT